MIFRSLAVACGGVVLAFGCQWGMVYAAYGGNWTALFCAGDQFHRPAEIDRQEYVWRGSSGYDGQFYQLIAHDPLFRRHYDTYIDAPRVRYRRILIPGLAYVLAGAQPAWIDWGYYAACLLFIGIGTFCLAELAAQHARSTWWGLLFFLNPATLSALDRLTTDVALAAIIPAALLAARARHWVLLWIALAAAALGKETGVLLFIAVAIWLLREGRMRLVLALGSSLLPAVLWYWFVETHTGGEYRPGSFVFLAAFFSPAWQPLGNDWVALLFRATTLAAVAALLWSAVRSVILTIRNRFRGLDILLCFLFAVLLLVVQTDAIWTEPNGFTRVHGMLMMSLLAATLGEGFRQTLLSYLVVSSPLSMQMAVHLFGPLVKH